MEEYTLGESSWIDVGANAAVVGFQGLAVCGLYERASTVADGLLAVLMAWAPEWPE